MEMEVRILLLIFISVVYTSEDNRYVLKQILILSRHNLRTPLSKVLADVTPKPWPHWKEKSGYLTEKGALLEGFMGEFFASWLFKEGLLPEGCPTEDVVYVYANTKQRTRASAKAFVNKAFPGCNVTIHTSTDKIDPTFDPVIHNTSTIFRQIALEEMQHQLKSLSLNDSYEALENILDYKDSEICKTEAKCDLITDKNKIYFKAGEKPNILGPLKICNSAIDAFVMENYEGFPEKKVAWGELDDMHQWETIMNLSRGYHNVIFNTTLVAKDIAEPLIKYISKIFLNGDTSPKITLLMGHDANMYTILNSMRFKTYNLPKQCELTPVGGKIAFQRWFDNKNKKDLLRINYIYQSTLQLRNGLRLTLEKPPQFVVLELKDCEVDSNGFCLWDDFKKLLQTL